MQEGTAATAQKYQRRMVLVKKRLQLKYVGFILGCAVFMAIISSGDTFYTMYTIALMDNPSLAPLVHQIQSMILVKLVLFLGIVFLGGLFLSHRLAGPIYRFEKSAQVVGCGDLTHRVCLRTGDELLEFQEEFNHMVARLQALVQKDRTLARRLAGHAEQILKNLPPASATDGIGAAREGLKSLHSELEHITAGFKI